MYDWEWQNGKLLRGGTPWAPNWLLDRIGVDFFGRVTYVSFRLKGELALQRKGNSIASDVRSLAHQPEATAMQLWCI